MQLLDQGRIYSKTNLFKGHGTVHIKDLLGAQVSAFQAVLACVLDPQASVGTHLQTDADEVIIIHQGHGQAYINQKSYPLEAGVVLHVKQGQTLSLHNHSTSDSLHYHIIKTRASNP